MTGLGSLDLTAALARAIERSEEARVGRAIRGSEKDASKGQWLNIPSLMPEAEMATMTFDPSRCPIAT
jgi:hypothetical protein